MPSNQHYQKKDNIYIEKIQVEQKLDSIGISENVLIESAMAGVLAKANSTIFDTKGMAGYIQWNDTNSRLRFLTHNKGWEAYQENGIEGIISADKKIRIIPSSGNAATGNPDQPSANKNRKGEGSIKIFEPTVQGNIFTGFADVEPLIIETYILLYYSDNKELKTELSKPAMIDSTGIIRAWDERIILQKQSLSDSKVEFENIESEEIDIPVIKKEIKG